MNKIEILRVLSYLCAAGLFIYAWQLSVDKRTSERVKAQFSKDGKFVLVSGMKEGNSIINISREGEVYGGNILVKVEEPEEWYEKLQEEIKLYSQENR